MTSFNIRRGVDTERADGAQSGWSPEEGAGAGIIATKTKIFFHQGRVQPHQHLDFRFLVSRTMKYILEFKATLLCCFVTAASTSQLSIAETDTWHKGVNKRVYLGPQF